MLGMNEAVVDTNVYVYGAIEDSEFHERAAVLLESLSVWHTPVIVVHEVVWSMKGLVGDEATIRFVEALLGNPKTRVYPVSGGDVAAALGRIRSSGLSLSRYNDELVLSVAMRIRKPVLSFDRRLLSRAMRLGVPVLSPYPEG